MPRLLLSIVWTGVSQPGVDRALATLGAPGNGTRRGFEILRYSEQESRLLLTSLGSTWNVPNVRIGMI